MIHHELTSSVLRVLGDGKTYGDEYDAVATLVWLSPIEVEMRAFKGRMTRPLYRQLLQWFSAHGVETVRASRMGAHRLPGATLHADGYWYLDVQALVRRWTRT